MTQYIAGNNKSIIILHEIYGVNKFIEETSIDFFKKGYDVYSPSMNNNYVFDYKDEDVAYKYFYNNNNFEIRDDILAFTQEAINKYEKNYILGFSVGATMAWKCSEKIKCDGIICCYGSKIREFLSVKPISPVLMLLSNSDPLDEKIVTNRFKNDPLVQVESFNAKHGFIDEYNPNYDIEQAVKTKTIITDFLNK